MRKQIGALVLLAVLWSFCIPGYGADKRPMTPDDLFRFEVLGPVAISPDGGSIAYVLQRPVNTVSRFGLPYLRGNDHADVWLVPVQSGNPKQITDGDKDASGFWEPKWSPDGEHLALYSTRGGNIRIWVWSRESGSLRMVSELGTDPGHDGMVWLSNRELLYSVLRDEKSQSIVRPTQTPEAAARGSSRQKEGTIATASVLDSGVPGRAATKLGSELLLTDLPTGKTTVIATGQSFASLCVSPDGQSVAFFRQTGLQEFVPSHRVQRFDSAVYEVGVASSRSQWTAQILPSVHEPIPDSLLWSHDGAEVAFIGFDDSTNHKPQVFRCGASHVSCRVGSNGLLDLDLGPANQADPAPLQWLANGNLLIYARSSVSDDSPRPKPSLRWWLSPENGPVREFLQQDIKIVPTRLIAEADGQSLLGIIDGNVWRIGPKGDLVQNLTPHSPSKIRSITSPLPPDDAAVPALFLRGESADQAYVLDLRSLELIPTMPPSASARLAGFNAARRTIAYTGNDDTGTFLWFKVVGQDQYQNVATNQFVKEIAGGKLQNIKYRGSDGQELYGWAILPPNCQEGTRYPVVTWVYLGETYGTQPPRWLVHVNDSSVFNLQVLAAHGYVVLIPSMPSADGEAADPFLELTKGVLPAVEKLVDLGIADPDRLGIMGQSFGGYSTYGIIEQTNRFKAAVASAGFSDFISLYGTLNPESRYEATAQEATSSYMWLAESGQEQMGSPPWKDLGRYLRNSPVNYVDRVETPLLIIQGDLDFIPMQQGEEFFDFLYRQNKRAEFVRYWGEGHIFDSPANIRDMWERVFAWFDQFLRKN